MKDAFRVRNHLNPPKFYFNFIGPKSDEQVYLPAFPDTELSLSLSVGGAATREFNLLGVMESLGHQQGRGIAELSKDKDTESEAMRLPVVVLKRRAEAHPIPTRLAAVDSATNRTGQPAPPADGKALVVAIGSSNEKEEVMLETSKAVSGGKAPPSTNPNAKRMKAIAVENDIIPKNIQDPTAIGSGPDGVILKGFLKKNTIVCLCHDQGHTLEDFVQHARAPCNGGGAFEPKCFITVSTVSRGDFIDVPA